MAAGIDVLDPDERLASHRQRTSGGALLLAGTTAPNVLNMLNRVEAVFDNPFVFRDRFSGADDFYKPNCELPLVNRRSPGYRRVEPVHDQQLLLLLDRPARERPLLEGARAHVGGDPDLHGKGYTYTWPERLGVTPWKDGHADQARRLDYEPVGMVSAAPGGARWYHQHFSMSKEPFRLTAWFGPHNPGRDPGAPRREAHRLRRSTSRTAAPRSRTGWRIPSSTESG